MQKCACNPSSPSILVDDIGGTDDVVARVRDVYTRAFSNAKDYDREWRTDVSQLAGIEGSMRSWIANQFFDKHRERYSKSRRRAPIYWQLATPSATYSVWLYYHRFTRDTLFRLLNDHVVPKLQHEERKLTGLTRDAGRNPSASQRKEIDTQEQFVAELRAFRDEVARVAPLWNPDLNDGVIINFAPLWRLVPHNRSWQKECKKVWDKLVAGDYDWAQLAMDLWPERVVPKCPKDRSLAIAHGLEEVFWEGDEDGKWQPKKVSRDIVDQLIAERTSAAVKAALDDLLRSPAPTRRRRSTIRRTATASRRNASPVRPKVDSGILEAVKKAISAAGSGATRSQVIDATGISNSEWNAAINALLAQGTVTRTGVARGTRYHLAGKGGRA